MPIEVEGMTTQKSNVSIFDIVYKNGKYTIDMAFHNKRVSYDFTPSTIGLTLKKGISALRIDKGDSFPGSLSPSKADFTYYTDGNGTNIIPIKIEISPSVLVKFKAEENMTSNINVNNFSFKKGKRTLVYDVMPQNLEGLIWARGPIHNVNDGDSFSIFVKEGNGVPVGESINVRLVGINTTEKSYAGINVDLHQKSVENNTKWLIQHGLKTDSENLQKNLELSFKHAVEAAKMIEEEFMPDPSEWDNSSKWALAIIDDRYMSESLEPGKDAYGRWVCNVYYPISAIGYSAISINKSLLATESTIIPGTALAIPYVMISGNGVVESRFPVSTWWQFSFDYEKRLQKLNETKDKPVVDKKEEFLKDHGLKMDYDGTLYYGDEEKLIEIRKYVFKEGDTWQSIAEAFTNEDEYTSAYDILKENGLTGSFMQVAADTKAWVGKEIKVPIYKTFGNSYFDYMDSQYASNVNNIPADCEADDYITLIYDDRDILDGISRENVDYMKALYDGGFLRIGDCTFSIPPLAIKIDSISTSRQVPTLRSKSSIQTNTGHTVRIITLRLFFSDEDQINGYPYEMPGLGETFYRNGLRPLIAQFKKAPFLPIENKVINETHKIYSVAFKDLQLNSVPGFPGCIEATLSLFEFDHTAYMPYEEYFAGTFNWKLFRWYYQRPMQISNKYMNRLYLEKINMLDDSIRFFVPDENILAQRQQSIKDLQNKIDAEGYAKANSSSNEEPGKQILDADEFKIAKQEHERFKAWLSRYPMTTYGRFYNSRGIFDPSELLEIPPANKQEKENYVNALLEYFELVCGLKTKWSTKSGKRSISNQFTMDMLRFVPNNISVIVRFLSANGYTGLRFSNYRFTKAVNTSERSSAYEDNSISGMFKYDRVYDAGGYYALNLRATKNRMLTSDILESRYIISPDDIIKCKMIEFGEQEVLDSFENYKTELEYLNYMAHMSEQDVPVVEFNVNDVIVLGMSAVMANNLATIQLQSSECPVFQYLGSQDTKISIDLAVLTKEGLSNLYKLMSTTQRYARDYRIAITSGVLTIKNNLLSLLGVKDFIIENMTVNTSEADKETFVVNLRLIAFDKTQRLREDIDYASIGEGIDGKLETFEEFSKRKATDNEGFEYGAIDFKLRDLEVYPDLELPTYKEVNAALPFLDIYNLDGSKMYHLPNPTGARFVDPDFYIRASQTYREYIAELLKSGTPAIILKDDHGFEAVELGPEPDAKTMEKPNVNFSDETMQWIKNNIGEIDYGELERHNPDDYEGPFGTYSDYSSKVIQNAKVKQECIFDIFKKTLEKIGIRESDTHQKQFSLSNNLGSSTVNRVDPNRVNILDTAELNKYRASAKNASTLAVGNFKQANGVGESIVFNPGEIFREPSASEIAEWFGGIKSISDIKKNPSAEEFSAYLYSLVKLYFPNHPSDLDKIEKGLDCATYMYGQDYISAPEITQEKITNILKALFDYESTWRQFVTKNGEITLNTNIKTESGKEAFAVGIAQINIINTGVNDLNEARRAAWDWKYCLDLGVKTFAYHFNACAKSSGEERNNPLDYAIIRYNWPAKGNYNSFKYPIEMSYYRGVFKRFAHVGANAQEKSGGYGKDRAFWEATPDTVFDESLMSVNTAKNYLHNIMEEIAAGPQTIGDKVAFSKEAINAYVEKMNSPVFKNAKVFAIRDGILSSYTKNLNLRYPGENKSKQIYGFNIGVFDPYGEFSIARSNPSSFKAYGNTKLFDDKLQAALYAHLEERFKNGNGFDYTSNVVVVLEGAAQVLAECSAQNYTLQEIPWSRIYKLIDIDTEEAISIAANIRRKEIASYMYYNPADIAENYRSGFRDILDYDQRGRLVRAFPTYQMFIIDEGRWLAWHKLWDNFYGYNSIVSIDIYKDRRVVADTAVIQMTNVYGNLSTHDSEIKYGEWEWKFSDLFFGSEEEQKRVWSQFLGIPSEEILRARKERLDSLVLKPGARINLRLGYGANAYNLPVVFNGTITEMDTQEIMTIVAQGDGRELTNKLNVDPDKTTDPGLFGGIKEPREMICELLTSRGGYFKNLVNKLSKGVFFNTHPLGIVHFGNQIVPDSLLRTNLFDLNTDYGEAGMNVYSGAGINTFSQWIYTHGPKKGESIGWDWGHTPLPVAKGDEPNIKIYLFDKTPWDIIQIYAAVCPDYIASVIPFEYRSTLFFGKPWWGVIDRYEYKYKWDNNLNAVVRTPIGARRKAFAQCRIYQSGIDIIKNAIVATDQYMYTNVIGVYNEADGAKKTSVVQVDSDIYPEHQTTALVHIPIQASKWGNLWTQDKYAFSAATSTLRDYVKEMYQGEIIVIGDPTVKPYDVMYISDTFTDMNGNTEVKRVVHNFSFDTGFVTSISPDCISVIDDLQGVSIKSWYGVIGATLSAHTAGLLLASHAWRKIISSPVADALRKWGASGTKFVLKDLLAKSMDDTMSKQAVETVSDKIADWIMSKGMDDLELAKRGIVRPDIDVDDVKLLRVVLGDSNIRALQITDEVLDNISKAIDPIKKLYKDPGAINKIVDDAWKNSGWLNNKYIFGAPKEIHEFKVKGKLTQLIGKYDDIVKALKEAGDEFEYIRRVGTKRNNILVGLGNVTFKTASGAVKTGIKVGVKGSAKALRTITTIVKTIGITNILAIAADLTLTYITASVVEKYARFLRSRQALTIIPLNYRSKPYVAGINGHQGAVHGDIPSTLDAFFSGAGFAGDAVSAIYSFFGIEAPDYSGNTGVQDIINMRE